MELFNHIPSTTPILGVCLGMQAIAIHFGGSLINQKEVKHGVQTKISIVRPGKIFNSLPTEILVGLYHSWMVDENNIPKELLITSYSSEGVPMSLEHSFKPIVAVQFHPESVLTEFGEKMISNFLFGSW
jgi:anthranilate synthase component 2